MIVYFGITYLAFSEFLESIGTLVFVVWSLLCFLLGISQFANGARRLEDMGVNKWSLLIVFIPIIGLFFTLYLCVTPSVTKKRKR